MRAFIAIDIPDEIKDDICRSAEMLRKDRCLKIVPKENLHITLKFLGEMERDEAEEALHSSVSKEGLERTALEIFGAGAFPSLNFVRVLWVGVKGGEKLFGLFGEKHPHITVARAKCKPRLANEFIKKNAEKSFGRFNVEKISLYESILEKPHPRYLLLDSIEI